MSRMDYVYQDNVLQNEIYECLILQRRLIKNINEKSHLDCQEEVLRGLTVDVCGQISKAIERCVYKAELRWRKKGVVASKSEEKTEKEKSYNEGAGFVADKMRRVMKGCGYKYNWDVDVFENIRNLIAAARKAGLIEEANTERTVGNEAIEGAIGNLVNPLLDDFENKIENLEKLTNEER